MSKFWTYVWFLVPGLMYRCGAPRPLGVHVLDDYFKSPQILSRVAQFRVKIAQKRHDQYFYFNLNKGHRNPHSKQSPQSSPIESILPPRRSWIRPSSRLRKALSPQDITARSIVRAVYRAQRLETAPKWLRALDAFIDDVQSALRRSQTYEFVAPKIIFIPKSKQKQPNVWRPIAIYEPRDQIVIGLAAQYLRDVIDSVFLPCSYAFRGVGTGGKSPPTHHDAVERLREYIISQGDSSLFVAECDIKKFFDSVNHNLAFTRLRTFLRDLRQQGIFYDRRILSLFRTYLHSYNFPQLVLSSAKQFFKTRRIIDGKVEWIEPDLPSLYPGGQPTAIGVPQGGAFSPIIANLLLHEADRAIYEEAERKEFKEFKDFFYARYCDDMILLSPSKEVCATLLDTYLKTLRNLKLAYHEPVESCSLEKYYSEKSKTYELSNAHSTETRQWVSFLGYQIRRDGIIRVRKDSIRKEIEKQVDIYRSALRSLRVHGKTTHRTRWEILHRCRMKLITMSVGRSNLARFGPSANHNMCWVSGFRLLKTTPFVASHIKKLDRSRNKIFRKLDKKLRKLEPLLQNTSTSSKKLKRDLPKVYGAPYSYLYQFRREKALGHLKKSEGRV